MGKRNGSKRRDWEKLIAQRSRTGESVAEFCRRVGVPVHQFYWWQRKLFPAEQQVASTDERAKTPATAPFLEVRLPSVVEDASAPIEVVHPSGWVVRVPAGCDPMVLRHVLLTLDTPTSATQVS